MLRNKVKAKLLAGEKVFGVGFTFPLLQAVEIVGDAGFDFIHIEGEHGVWSLKDIEETCMVANALGLTVHARVPNIHPSTILRFLDRGVQGIMGPHIRSQADTEALVAACRFANPLRTRSTRASSTRRQANTSQEVTCTQVVEGRDARRRTRFRRIQTGGRARTQAIAGFILRLLRDKACGK